MVELYYCTEYNYIRIRILGRSIVHTYGYVCMTSVKYRSPLLIILEETSVRQPYTFEVGLGVRMLNRELASV